MYYHKIDHPKNFRVAALQQSEFNTSVDTFDTDTFRITVRNPRWSENFSDMLGIVQATPIETVCSYELRFEDRSMKIRNTENKSTVLKGHEDLLFGVCKEKWLFCFELQDGDRFYGMGEKNIGFEKHAVRTKFWNTDVWADFAWSDIDHGSTDPMYASFPVLLLKRNDIWIGFMIPTSSVVFMDTGARQMIEGAKQATESVPFFYLGAQSGSPDMIISVASTAKDIVSRFTKLLGLPPVPPLWALGHHQSRWGYATVADAAEIDKQLLAHGIPCDAIWFDIDYLQEYRIFTRSETPSMPQSPRQRKLVAILDPGIKADGYPIDKELLENNLACLNSEHLPYIGFVWPGASHFPDFYKPEATRWWKEKTAELAKTGFDAFWVDMNDPSTGSMELDEMCFDDGKIKHHDLHNWYALGMAKATWDGLKQAHPDKRPFLLSRSGMLGSHRYGALWTGDSISNYHHLAKNIEMILSMSLSTMAFVGSDIGGFGSDCSDELIVDWYRACLMVPLMRNHSADGTRRQEPWAFSTPVMNSIKQVIRMRYALLPYLYSLFHNLSTTGEPIWRPMIYESNDPVFEHETGQFFIGDALLQIVKLKSGETKRELVLPEGLFLSLTDGTQIRSRTTIDFSKTPIPLFVREGSFIPIALVEDRLIATTADIDLSKPIMLYYPGSAKHAAYTYWYDDKDGYEKERSINIVADQKDNDLHIKVSTPCTLAIAGKIDGNIMINNKEVQAVKKRLPLEGTHLSVRWVCL